MLLERQWEPPQGREPWIATARRAERSCCAQQRCRDGSRWDMECFIDFLFCKNALSGPFAREDPRQPSIRPTHRRMRQCCSTSDTHDADPVGQITTKSKTNVSPARRSWNLAQVAVESVWWYQRRP